MQKQQFYLLLFGAIFVPTFLTAGAPARTSIDLDPATSQTMDNAAAQGFPLRTSFNMSGPTGIPKTAGRRPSLNHRPLRLRLRMESNNPVSNGYQ